MVLTHFPHPWCRADGVEIEVQNLVEHLLIGLVRGCLEEIAVTAPERVHEQHRAQHPRRDRGVDGAKLAAPHTALDDSRDEAEDALDHLTPVEAREVGKIAELRVNETEERGEIWRPEESPVSAHEMGERLRRRLLRRRRELALGALDLRDDRLPDHLAEQLFLVGEVQIDRALRETGALGDVLESRRREPTLAEDGERGIDDLLRSLLRQSAPARLL